MAVTRSAELSVCCMSSGRSPERLASILALFGAVADEIVVAVEEPRAAAAHEAVATVANRVLAFPPTGPADRPIAWLFGACTGKWILNIDDDEVPSPALIERLPGLVARDDITHAWIARRWLFPTCSTYLDEAPWSTEFQLRLLLADDRFLQFSDVFHRPVIAHGPGVYVDAPLWHLDTAVNPAWRRRSKAEAYELERPGMKVGGRAHNHAFYLPELRPDVALAPVPPTERAQIERVAAGVLDSTRAARASLIRVSSHDVDLPWPGLPYRESLHRGRISAVDMPSSWRAGVQQTIDVLVTNDSDETWRWGKEARPEIRLGYGWSLDGAPVAEPAALRTTLPADLAPGATALVPVHVVPPVATGRHILTLELVHEGVEAFATTTPVELDVRERQLLAVIGKPAAIARTLAVIASPPEVEPVVVLGNDSDRAAYGDYPTVSGLRAPLLAGLETSGRLTRAVKLSWRSFRIVGSARRCRRSGVTYDSRLADAFDLFLHARGLVVASTDWPDDAAPGREWWRLVTTMRACRAIGHDVLVADAAVPQGAGLRAAVLRRAVRRYSTPVRDLAFDTPPVEAAASPPEPEPAEALLDVLV